MLAQVVLPSQILEYFAVVGVEQSPNEIRISLDETERMLKDHFHIECACVGSDKKMSVFTTAESREEEIIQYLSEKTNLHRMAFEVRFIEAIPKNDTGG